MIRVKRVYEDESKDDGYRILVDRLWPRGLTKEFVLKAKALGFQGLRFHDLRGSYETALLDAGVPVHVVAARCGRPGRAVAQLCQTHQESRHQRGSGAISKGALR